MVDVVTSQIYDGEHNVVVMLNSVSDGTGQVGATILDPSTLTPNPTTHLVLWRCSYDIKGGGVNVYWDASTPRSLLAMSGQMTDRDFSRWGGLKNDAVNPTGIVKINTIGFVANSGYSITLEFKKGGQRVGQAAPGNLSGVVLTMLREATARTEQPIVIVAPVNVDIPYASGTGAVGETLNCTMGNWENEPAHYVFQWKSGDVDVGINESSYVVAESDVGFSITCIVTAINRAGAVAAPSSNPIPVIPANGSAEIRSAPTPARAAPTPAPAARTVPRHNP